MGQVVWQFYPDQLSEMLVQALGWYGHLDLSI